MNAVIQIINNIMARALNRRQFRMLLDEVDSMYSDLLLDNKVWWLSKDEMLKRFVVCLKEGKTFLDSAGLNHPQLEQAEKLEKFNFIIDMTAHLNTLNTVLQGRGRTARHVLEDVLAIERKFMVFARDLQRGTLSHFPCLREFKQTYSDISINLEFLQSAIIAMQSSLRRRF